MTRHLSLFLAAAAATSVVACASTTVPKSAATAVIEARSGSAVSGSLRVVPMGDGVHITGRVAGLAPNGTHAFHIHEHGDCSAADASSAGGHFDPTLQPHGRAGQGDHHMGDSDNLKADANGVALVDAHFANVSLDTHAANDVMDKAIVIHADPDDYRSQPAGNAGKRIGCGVIR